MFRGALLRREGVRGFGFGNGCSGVIQMTRDGRRQVGTGRIGVGSVTVVTITKKSARSTKYLPECKDQCDSHDPCPSTFFYTLCQR